MSHTLCQFHPTHPQRMSHLGVEDQQYLTYNRNSKSINLFYINYWIMTKLYKFGKKVLRTKKSEKYKNT